MNPWHDVTVGSEVPEVVNAIIEIPKNTRAKYELDKKGFGKLNDAQKKEVEACLTTKNAKPSFSVKMLEE